jgi:hypothetical protein
MTSRSEEMADWGDGSLLREHLALSVTGALIILSVLHVYLFSLNDLTTSLAVLEVVDRTQLLIATGASALSFVAFAALWYRPSRRWLWRGNMFSEGEVEPSMLDRFVSASAITIGLVLALRVVSPVLIVGLALFRLFIVIARRRAKSRGDLSDDGAILVSTPRWQRYRGRFALLLVFLFVLSMQEPWVPTEELRLSAGARAVGYVMGVDGDQLLLVDRHRDARWISVADIKARRICGVDPDSWWARSVQELVLQPGYQTCRD